MSNAYPEPNKLDLHKLQQFLKWTVYTLLIVNWGFYIAEDWTRASHALTDESSLLHWARQFAVSIDELAWFLLLFMFELETYVLEAEDWTGWARRVVHGIRLLCFVMIAHTVFAYVNSMVDLQTTAPVEDTSSLCDLIDRDLSFVHNLDYTELTEANCKTLSSATNLYWVADYPVVTGETGLELERDLALADIFEVTAWLLVIVAIEVVVRLQDRGIAGGTLMKTLNHAKIFLYLFILSIGIYWASLGHWLCLWDEFLWIGGFIAIETNLSGWRNELREEAGD